MSPWWAVCALQCPVWVTVLCPPALVIGDIYKGVQPTPEVLQVIDMDFVVIFLQSLFTDEDQNAIFVSLHHSSVHSNDSLGFLH